MTNPGWERASKAMKPQYYPKDQHWRNERVSRVGLMKELHSTLPYHYGGNAKDYYFPMGFDEWMDAPGVYKQIRTPPRVRHFYLVSSVVPVDHI